MSNRFRSTSQVILGPIGQHSVSSWADLVYFFFRYFTVLGYALSWIFFYRNQQFDTYKLPNYMNPCSIFLFLARIYIYYRIVYLLKILYLVAFQRNETPYKIVKDYRWDSEEKRADKKAIKLLLQVKVFSFHKSSHSWSNCSMNKQMNINTNNCRNWLTNGCGRIC